MPIAITAPPVAVKDMSLPQVSENKRRKIICFSGMHISPHLPIYFPLYLKGDLSPQ